MIDRAGNILTHLSQPPFDNSWSAAARNNWTKLSNAIHDKMRIDDVLSGPANLTVPRRIRKENAEHLIISLANQHGFPPSQHSKSSVWASDGSMIPSSAGVLDTKMVIGAATGAQTSVMRLSGNNISILHGELVGMISALVLSKTTGNDDHRLLTDHINTVRLVDDSQTGVDQNPRLRFMNGRSYYRWLLDLTNQSKTQIDYTPGHSTETTLEAKLNNEADFYASKSQKFAKDLPIAPIPTFFMNNFTVYSRTDSWIESNIPSYVDALMTRQSATALGIGHGLRMSTWAHDNHTPPDYPYIRATSAHSAAVQLYARSGQLATADLLFRRGKVQDNGCRLGCNDVENMRHIFVKCAIYQQWRDEARQHTVESTTLKLTTMQVEGAVMDVLISAAESLFSDHPTIWPLHLTMFYLGQIPDLDTLIPPDHGLNKITMMKLKTHLSSDWHMLSIRLAGRIFGDYQRRMASLNNIPLKTLSYSSRTNQGS